MFTLGTAISRLTNSGKNAFPATFTDAQKIQRVNEVLERFYDLGSWRGVFDTIVPVPVLSVITLPVAYQRLDGLSDDCGGVIPIKSMSWQFQPNGPGVIHTTTEYCPLVAIDLGDVAGLRKYQLTGTDAINDARTLIGLARKRFTWLTDTAAVIEPDSFQALKLGVKALRAEDEGDTTRKKELMSEALAVLDSNLDEFEGETGYGPLQIDPFVGAGEIPNLV